MRLSIAGVNRLVADASAALGVVPHARLPVLCPRLAPVLCPRIHHSPPPPAPAEEEERWWGFKGSGLPRRDGGAAGLVGCAESGTRDVPPRRYGLRGLTANGRRRVQQGCCLLEEQRALLSFWTVTVPPQALASLIEKDMWPRFQETIRHRLQRRLRLAGLPPLALAVAELHPGRSARGGQAMPHLHVLFRGRLNTRSPWALSPKDLDGIIGAALKACGIIGESLNSAGNVKSIKRSVKRYLSKYVTKASQVFKSEDDWLGRGDPAGLPRQWWFMTSDLLAMVKHATVNLPPAFLSWLVDRALPPRKGQLYVVQRVAIKDPRAPSMWRVVFRSPWALFLSWEAYESALIIGPHPHRKTIRRDGTLPLLHSFEHQFV